MGKLLKREVCETHHKSIAIPRVADVMSDSRQTDCKDIPIPQHVCQPLPSLRVGRRVRSPPCPLCRSLWCLVLFRSTPSDGFAAFTLATPRSPSLTTSTIACGRACAGGSLARSRRGERDRRDRDGSDVNGQGRRRRGNGRG